MLPLNNNSGDVYAKAWVPNYDYIDEGSRNQLENIRRLPFLYKWTAMMPDCHEGYGVPIGCVLPTEGVIIPNAVGVDIGCVDKDTEYLSPGGWIKVSEYAGGEVMQFDPQTKLGTFVTPLAYIKEPCLEFVHIKSKYGIDQMLSEEHRCLVYKYDRKYTFSKSEVVRAKDLMDKHNNLATGYRHRFLTTFEPVLPHSNPLSDAQLRVMVMLCADGHLYKKGTKCHLKLKKRRKIDRALFLLDQAGIAVTHQSITADGSSGITFVPPAHDKGLCQFWNASLPQLKVIAAESLYWDGNYSEKCFYTRSKEDADFMNYVYTVVGFRSTISIDVTEDGIDYRVFRHTNTLVGINGAPKTSITMVPSVDGYKYCFTVPSSYLVLRRNGNVFITGNCGMLAVETNLMPLGTAREDLETVVAAIKRDIPVGFAHRSLPQMNLLPELPEKIGAMSFVMSTDLSSASKQLGTLGGGNHFIEIQAGSDGYIWIMIHSGSRNIGLCVAKHWNKIAQDLNARWHTAVPRSADLAFLPLESDEGQAYLADMQWCVEFADANRKLMMDCVMSAMAEVFTEIREIAQVSTRHNYAAMEHHMGRNVMIHRKGAVLAREGTLVCIPGSMGTASYIAKGLGKIEAYQSCSHGAGRAMGRKQAQKSLDLAAEQERMNNIVHDMTTQRDLEEAPSAYKDIEDVMRHQAELVEPVVKLTPLAVVKG